MRHHEEVRSIGCYVLRSRFAARGLGKGRFGWVVQKHLLSGGFLDRATAYQVARRPLLITVTYRRELVRYDYVSHALAVCGVRWLGLLRKPQLCDVVT